MNPAVFDATHLNTQMQITRTQTNDLKIQTLVVLLDQELRSLYGNSQDRYKTSNDVSAGFPAVLLESDVEPIGMGAFKQYDEQSVELKRMFVKPAYRGQGLSKLIVKELEQYIQELGYSCILIETGPKQPAAHALYQHFGYQACANFGFYAGMEDRSLCMRKLIK